MAEANRPDGAADRLTRIQRVLDEVLMRRAAGETLPDDVVVSQHSDLMPELGERLQALKSAQEAGRPAVPPRPAAAGASNPLEGRCPFCQSRVRVKAEHAGRRVRCKCGRVFVADLPSGGDGAFAIPPPPPELAVPIAGYEIERELGLGGMGRVYLAREVATKRQVALKVMLAGRSANERDRRRFEREVEIAASLEHPNIARLYATGIHEGHYWFAMEYVEGERLDQFAARRNLGVRDILVLFGRVCEGVNYAHQRGIMHRDLKPGNILVDRAGQPRVLDLGLAKVADPTADIEQTISMGGELAGTPAYMSPEQIQGGTTGLDVRSDVYSLGVVLYQLLTGQSPYGPTTGLPDLLRAVVEREPQPPRQVRPDIPDEVAAIILKAIEKHRAQRYQTAGDLGRDIAAHLAGKPVSAKGQGGWYRLRKMLVRHKRVAITVAAVAGLSLGLGLLFASLYSKTRVELQEVIREKEVWRDRVVGPKAPVSTPVPPPAATPAPAPKTASPWVRIFDGETLSGWGEPTGGSGSARVNNGAIEVTCYELINTAIYHQMEASDMAISAQVKKVAGDHGSMYLRHGPKGVYLATFKGGGEPGDFQICKWHSGGGGWPELAVNKTPITLIGRNGHPGNEGFFEMTFRAVGTRLTVEVQGREILRAEDADIDYGSPGIGGTALFRDIYVWVPDKQGPAGSGQPGAGAPASSTGAHAAGTSQALPVPNTLTPEEQASGWRLLFDGKTTVGWRGYRAADLPEGWRVEDSALVGAGNRSHIVTTAQYDDFDLTLECMIEKRGNSGIMYRVTEDADEPYHTGPEFQILGDPAYGNQNSNGKAGACYGLYAPRQQVAMPPDTWIKIRLLAAGSFVQHWVNGEKVVEYRIGSDDWNQRLAACQFRDKPKFGRNSTGYICLQAYTGTLRFRNIKIRRLTAHGEGPAVGAMPEKTISLDLGGGVTLPLTLVPAGKFVMGSPDSEQGRVPNEGLQHEVTISKPFYMGVTEVTQAQYEAVMGTNPSRFKGPTNPVERVSWDDAVLFCRELSEKTRKAFRLPTEAEWEYACRAGSKTRFSFGDSDSVFSYAWFGSNSGGKTNPVGCTKPNAWGLYDMHGNVSEWCADWYGSYSSGASTDPQGAGSGGDRVVRGGSWLDDDSVYFRCAVRYNLAPSFRSHDVGFRCAMTP